MPEKRKCLPLLTEVFANMPCFVSFFFQMPHSAVSELLTVVRIVALYPSAKIHGV